VPATGPVNFKSGDLKSPLFCSFVIPRMQGNKNSRQQTETASIFYAAHGKNILRSAAAGKL